ncbi:MAG: ATP-binding protein [Bacteroidetes bacterium]|nr:ATP-binding protein [Bacteroidota bacterium]
MKRKFQASFRLPALLLLTAIILVLITEVIQHRQPGPEKYVSIAEKNLRHLEIKMEQAMEGAAVISSDSVFHHYFIHQGFQDFGFSFFYLVNEKIVKWSDNETDITSRLADTCRNRSLVHLNNGWYEIFTGRNGTNEMIGLLLIRKEYTYENQYLVNRFNPRLELPPGTEPGNGKVPDSYTIHSGDGRPLFSARFTNMPGSPAGTDLKSWLYLVSVMLVLVAFFFTGKILSGISSWLLFLFMVAVVILRGVMISLRIPDEFYSTPLFSPQFYASSFYFNSLGDLIINSLILLCFSGIFYSSFGNRNFPAGSRFISQSIQTGSLLFIFLLTLPLNNLVSGLVVNSKISFDVGNLFGMDGYSVVGFLVIAILLWSFFLIVFAFRQRLFMLIPVKTFLTELVIAATIFALIYFGLIRSEAPMFSPVLLAVTTAMLVALIIRENKEEKIITLNYLLFITVLFAVYSSGVIWKLNDKKEKENRKLLIQKIETGQDQLAEYLFEDLGIKIIHDPNIQRHFKDTIHVREQVSKRLMQFYFTGYWSKFNTGIHCFDKNGSPFDSLHTKFSLDSLRNRMDEPDDHSPHLFFLGNESGQQEYWSVISIPDNNRTESNAGFIVIVLTPKLFQTDVGFPELFVSRKVAFNKDLYKYSYARYRNDSLLNQSGTFAYYFSAGAFKPSPQEYTSRDLDGYNHLVHRIGDKSFVVVSKSYESILLLFTLFSYLFSMFSLFFLVFYFVWRMFQRQNRNHWNLTRRIQSSVLLLVVLSFILIGSGTVYYITHKYDVNMDESISEKISSLLALMEKDLGDVPALTQRMNEEQQASLIRISGITDADFNLFSPEGNLCYSSQPKIFDQGIISQKMNPEALFEVHEKGRTKYVHPESIGNLNYIAAYEPLRNRQGKMIGYLHLPYFEKQNELNREISSFLSALINIYILLFALAVLATLFISSRITQPLSLIQEKLSNIRLGRKNEMIEYSRQDEIGQLVNEYNRMIDELAASAEKLARSERESAWREMAKQVAHEIKNPLTPMKLSVQHLQKAWLEKSPLLDEIFERISHTLVEQIDTLSNIAAEFSNFAQMPVAKKEKTDLDKILRSTIALFKELPGSTITFASPGKEKFVYADKDQLSRVFSNLLKNSTQAIPSDKKGVIHVSVATGQEDFIVSISDNGEGIPLEQVSRIFTPSFTTKSGGMGLGLSMVKSIVENSGGKIWFETIAGEGTVFFISLPAFSK